VAAIKPYWLAHQAGAHSNSWFSVLV